MGVKINPLTIYSSTEGKKNDNDLMIYINSRINATVEGWDDNIAKTKSKVNRS